MSYPKPSVVLALGLGAILANAMAAEVPVWAAPDGYKIDKFGKKIFVLDPRQDLAALKQKNSVWDQASKTVSLAAARGETVAFQLGIEGGQTGLQGVDVQASPLDGPVKLEAGRFELFKIYYTQVSDKGSGPTNGPTMGQGWYPDALVPWSIKTVPPSPGNPGYEGPPFAVAPHQIQGVWIDLTVPYGTPAGQYRGSLRLTAQGAQAVLPVVLTVRDFDIPRRIHNTFFMNFNMEDFNQAGGDWLKGDKITEYENEVYRIARRHRFTAGNMYTYDKPHAVETPAGELQSVDWTRYDAAHDKVLNPNHNLFGPGEEPIEIWKVPLQTILSPGFHEPWPMGEKAWDQMIVEIKQHWQAKGWDLSRAYVYLADEPQLKAAPMLNGFAKRVKDSPGPNLRRQIAVYTILGDQWNKQQAIFDLWKDNLDMWMVAGDYYSVPAMNALPAPDQKGMYQGGEPYQGNETLDADGVALRTWSWIAWRYRIDYQCYYSMSEAWRGMNGAVKRHGEIWDSPRNRPWALSQGVFIYPGNRLHYDLPIVNIRMKQIRRGQTDFEYFWLLKAAGEEDLANQLCRAVVPAALSEAAAAPERYGYGKWSHNPADWDEAVRKAGARLEQLKDKLPKESPASATAQVDR